MYYRNLRSPEKLWGKEESKGPKSDTKLTFRKLLKQWKCEKNYPGALEHVRREVTKVYKIQGDDFWRGLVRYLKMMGYVKMT